MASMLIDTDSEDELPAGWEERVTDDGKVFYAWYILCLSLSLKRLMQKGRGICSIFCSDMPQTASRRSRYTIHAFGYTTLFRQTLFRQSMHSLDVVWLTEVE